MKTMKLQLFLLDDQNYWQHEESPTFNFATEQQTTKKTSNKKNQHRNVMEEEQRCYRYGFEYDKESVLNGTKPKRRIYVGSNIGDDPWHTIEMVAAEGYGIYHTVAFVESNSTYSFTPRTVRFHKQSDDYKRLTMNKELYGPETKAALQDQLAGENIQRSMIIKRWKMNGMNTNDVGIIQDADETFSRDFLLAAQTCDIQQFRPGQNCKEPKIIASNLIFESSPSCIAQGRSWFHPDMIIGECIDGIGDEKRHPKAHRFSGGRRRRTSSKIRRNAKALYPLWNALDFRMTEGGAMITAIIDENGMQINQRTSLKRHTGYHFHNFFEDLHTLRHKYGTYGHSNEKAYKIPTSEPHSDLQMAVECALDRNSTAPDKYRYLPGGMVSLVKERQEQHVPSYFTKNEQYVQNRHEQFKQMILKEILY